MHFTEKSNNILRNLSIINENEFVTKEGDIYVATDVIAGDKRVLTEHKKLLDTLSKDTETMQQYVQRQRLEEQEYDN